MTCNGGDLIQARSATHVEPVIIPGRVRTPASPLNKLHNGWSDGPTLSNHESPVIRNIINQRSNQKTSECRGQFDSANSLVIPTTNTLHVSSATRSSFDYHKMSKRSASMEKNIDAISAMRNNTARSSQKRHRAIRLINSPE